MEDRLRARTEPNSAGELNYALSMAIIDYIRRKGLRYQTLAEVTGAIQDCWAEYQRRTVWPYEAEKADENGDLPWPTPLQ